MEQAFLSAWQKCREQAIAAGVRLRPMSPADAMKTAHRALSWSPTTKPTKPSNA